MRSVPACPLCGGAPTPLYRDCRDLEYFVPAPYALDRCPGCGLVVMDPLPARDELPRLYPPHYQNFDPPGNPVTAFLLDRYHAHHAAICRRYLPRDGSVLEIGAAGGDLLARLRVAGHERVRGVELSADACAVARARGLDVFHGTLEEFQTDERFDLVFMSHVIEHVPDPVATMARVAALLRPGGVAYVETPNVGALDARVWRGQWGLIHYPRHLYLFDRATLRRLLEGAGLAVTRVRSEINSCGWALSVQTALRRRGVDRSRRPRSAYYPFLLVGLLPLNLLDLCLGGTAFMSAVARKPAS
jgi:SAM-dependent methyltransferase